MSPRYNDLNDINARLAAIAAKSYMLSISKLLCCGMLPSSLLGDGIVNYINNYVIDVDTSPAVQGQAAPSYPKDGVDYGSPTEDGYKCQAAYYLTRSLPSYFKALAEHKEDILAAIDFGGTALSGAVTIIALAAAIPALVAATVLIVISATFLLVLLKLVTTLGDEWAEAISEVADFITTNEDDLACILYTATSVEQARNDFIDYIDANIGQRVFVVNGLAEEEKNLIREFLNNTNMNALFFEHPELDVSEVGTVDCGGCGGECPEVYTLWGTRTDTNHWASELQNGIYHVDLKFNYDETTEEYCGSNVADISVTVTSGSPYWQGGSNYTFRIQDQSGNNLYNSHTPPTDVDGAQTYFWSETAFEVDITWS